MQASENYLNYLNGEISHLENSEFIATDQHTFRMISGLGSGLEQLMAMFRYVKANPNCPYNQDPLKRL